VRRVDTAEALSVFQEARAADAQLIALTGHTERGRRYFRRTAAPLVTASMTRPRAFGIPRRVESCRD
jgi:hypothetical protein